MTQPPLVIGLAGQSGSGKSTLAELLSGAFGLPRTSFAASIRKAAVIAFKESLSRKHLAEWKDLALPAPLSTALKSDLARINTCHTALRRLQQYGYPIPEGNVPLANLSAALKGAKTPRDILCRLGTWFREEVAEDYWVTRLESRLTSAGYQNGAVIDDVRFRAERDWIIKQQGCLILVQKTGQRRPPPSAHISERDLGRPSDYPHVIRAKPGDLEGLLRQSVDAIGKWVTQQLHAQAEPFAAQCRASTQRGG